jgi:hypothetical protein
VNVIVRQKLVKSVIQDLKVYFLEALGLKVSLKSWNKEENLPFFLRNLYEFYILSLLEKSYLLAVARESDAITPATICKHVLLLQEKTGLPCIYTSALISSYNRKRLIVKVLPSEEEADLEIEVWHYDPKLFAKEGLVDVISLYLSLKENKDERVEAVLQKLMKDIKC